MIKPQTLTVLGSTGSIGRSTLSLVRAFPEKLSLIGLAANSSVAALESQIRLFRPKAVSVGSLEAREDLSKRLADLVSPPEILWGAAGLSALASQSGAQTVVSAVVGAAGLRPTWAALNSGLRVALANKESLVLGGEILMRKAEGRLSPIDSEHSAIFQALGGRLKHPFLRRVILTASGGPFRGWSREKLASVTPEMALRHPTWSMGPKITVDSATLMNKGLEVIEAHHLFNLGFDQIEVIVHPGSTVHSLAEFADGSLLAQLGPADMRLAIAYALSFPDRWPLLERLTGDDGGAGAAGSAGGADTQKDGKKVGFSGYGSVRLPPRLLFEKPDRLAFRALALAEGAGRAGGTAPAILNGANEVAVAAFLAGKLSFTGITEVVEESLRVLPAGPLDDIEDALEADGRARRAAEKLVAAKNG